MSNPNTDTDERVERPFFRPVRIEGWHKGIDGGGWYIKDARNKIILEVCFDENEELYKRPITGGNPAARSIVALINSDDEPRAASDAATRMRDRCLAKVRRKADSYQKDSERSDFLPNYRKNMALAATVLREVADDLQALTLEGEQEK